MNEAEELPLDHTGNRREGTQRRWLHVIQDFCSAIKGASDFQEVNRQVKEDPTFKDFEDELEAIQAWFRVLSCDERKYSLHALAEDARFERPPPGWI